MTQSPAELTAEEFTRRLRTFQSDDEQRKIQRYFRSDGDDVFIGVRTRHIFDLAKIFLETPPVEIEKLLDSPIHELRAGRAEHHEQAGRSQEDTGIPPHRTLRPLPAPTRSD